MDKEIEKRIEKVENNEREKPKGKLRSLLGKLNQKVLDSNGLLTSKGKYICKAEWHAVAIGFAFPFMAFMLPTPLGEFMIVAMLLMLRVGFKKLGRDLTGHLEDVMDELAYMLVTAALTIGYFTYFRPESLTKIDIGRALVQLLLGA